MLRAGQDSGLKISSIHARIFSHACVKNLSRLMACDLTFEMDCAELSAAIFQVRASKWPT